MSDNPAGRPGTPTSEHERARVLVSGTEIDGLIAGLALHDAGHAVTIVGPDESARPPNIGVVVVDTDLEQFIDKHAHRMPDDVQAASAYRTSVDEYRYLHDDGSILSSFEVELHCTATDTLERILRDAVPMDRIEHDTRTPDAQTPTHTDTPTDTQTPTHTDTQTHSDTPTQTNTQTNTPTTNTDSHPCDIHVVADGWLSDVRQRLLPNVTPDYAGYVAWSGQIPESAVPRDLTRQFEDAITVSRGSRDLLVAMLLPGSDGGTTSGARRLAWVWYSPVPPRDLGSVLTDKHGGNHDTAVPPGELQKRFTSTLHERASEHAPAITRLVRATPDPGVEPVVDLAVPQTVVGRNALVGDAAFRARQHTATNVTKSIQDAAALVTALDRYEDTDVALADWEHTQSLRGRQLVEQGRQTDLDELVGRA